jgi:hypothetical protein
VLEVKYVTTGQIDVICLVNNFPFDKHVSAFVNERQKK